MSRLFMRAGGVHVLAVFPEQLSYIEDHILWKKIQRVQSCQILRLAVCNHLAARARWGSLLLSLQHLHVDQSVSNSYVFFPTDRRSPVPKVFSADPWPSFGCTCQLGSGSLSSSCYRTCKVNNASAALSAFGSILFGIMILPLRICHPVWHQREMSW